MKVLLTNTTSVPIGGKRPGATFSVEADDDGVPVDIFWRKRLADNSVVKADAADSAAPAAPVARAASPKPAKPAKE